MAISSPSGFDLSRLHGLVRDHYAGVVEDPRRGRAAHHGIQYACGALGYERAALEQLPASAVARFAGIGNPLRAARIEAGETVVDIGCGSGVDLLLAAALVGPDGLALGVDLTPEMCVEAAANGYLAGFSGHVELRLGSIERLPVPAACADVVIANGVLNQASDKRRALREVCRILRPGGRVYLADVFLHNDLAVADRRDERTWASSIGGALPIEEFHALAASLGFETRVVERVPYIKASPESAALRATTGAHVAVIHAACGSEASRRGA